jgi:hypothetical protein
MDFSASSESYLPAYAALAEVERAVEGRLKRTLLSSRFADFELLLRYVPVVMPDKGPLSGAIQGPRQAANS